MSIFSSQVIVVAHAKPENIRPWLDDNNDTIEEEFKNLEITKKHIVKTSVGSLININNDVYVLGLLHGLKNMYDLFMYAFVRDLNGKYSIVTNQLEVIITSDELDLVLLKPINFTDKIVSINLEKFNKVIPNRDSLANLYIRNTKYKSKQQLVLDDRIYKCKVNNIVLENQQSYNMPILPYILICVDDDKFYETDDIGGISGSFVLDNNKNIVGIVSNIIIGTKNLSILPSVSICRFLEEFMKTDRFAGLCDIVGDLKLCEIETEEKELMTVMVTDAVGINYNKNILDRTDSIGNSLQDGDILYEVNGLEFDKKGKLYCDKIGMFIPLSTYIALEYISGDMIPLSIYRMNKDEHNSKKIKLKARPICTMKYIPISSMKRYYEYNGLIFMELTEEIIELYRNNSIVFTGPIIKYYDETPYRNVDEKVVILIGINKKKISDEYINVYDGLALPFIHKNENRYILPIISKINKKKITSLDNIEKLISKNGKNILYLLGDGKIKLDFDDSNSSLKYKQIKNFQSLIYKDES